MYHQLLLESFPVSRHASFGWLPETRSNYDTAIGRDFFTANIQGPRLLMQKQYLMSMGVA
jgi:hypothetical protein